MCRHSEATEAVPAPESMVVAEAAFVPMITVKPPMVPGIVAVLGDGELAVLGDGELAKDAVAVVSETVNAGVNASGLETVTLDGT